MSCGCGSLVEVRHFKRRYGLRHITRLDPHLPEGRASDERDHNVRAGVEDLAAADGRAALFPPRLFDKILALDNAYHYPCKEAFLRDCGALLPGGGRVAVSNLVLAADYAPWWVVGQGGAAVDGDTAAQSVERRSISL